MINNDMKNYNYYLYKDKNAYGQLELTDDIQGSLRIAIYNTSTNIQDNIKYKGAAYVGFTRDKNVSDNYVIDYNGEKLKVLYIPKIKSRYKLVYLANI